MNHLGITESLGNSVILVRRLYFSFLANSFQIHFVFILAYTKRDIRWTRTYNIYDQRTWPSPIASFVEIQKLITVFSNSNWEMSPVWWIACCHNSPRDFDSIPAAEKYLYDSPRIKYEPTANQRLIPLLSNNYLLWHSKPTVNCRPYMPTRESINTCAMGIRKEEQTSPRTNHYKKKKETKKKKMMKKNITTLLHLSYLLTLSQRTIQSTGKKYYN